MAAGFTARNPVVNKFNPIMDNPDNQSTTDLDTLPDAIEDLPPCARFVFVVLRRTDGWVTISTLKARTGYSIRTIREATNILLEEGFIEEGWRDSDPRERKYRNHP